jgi:hypothetical protein
LTPNINDLSGQVVERVLKASMIRESLDNVSAVMITFKNFSRIVDGLAGNNGA